MSLGGAGRARNLVENNRFRGLGGVKMASGPTAGSKVDSENSQTGVQYCSNKRLSEH